MVSRIHGLAWATPLRGRIVGLLVAAATAWAGAGRADIIDDFRKKVGDLDGSKRGDVVDELRKKFGDVEGEAKKALDSLRSAAPRVERDVCYGEVDGQRLMLDVYMPGGHDPAAKKPRPGVLVVHGGAWSGGKRTEPMCAALSAMLAREKFVVFNIDYRPVIPAEGTQPVRNRYPAAFDDCQRAVRWVRANADAYGVRASRLGAIGQSSGGHLVALLATRNTRDRSSPEGRQFSSRVQAAVDIGGPVDLTRKFSQSGNDPIQRWVNDFVGEGGNLAHEASPLFHIDERTSPMLIVHGAQDEIPIEHSRDLHAAMTKIGVPSTYIEFPGEGLKKPEHLVRFHRETITFFKKHLLASRKSTSPSSAPKSP